MLQVKKHYILTALLCCLFSINIVSAQADAALGKKLFKTNCASCHNKNMVDKLTGPALVGFEERWADYPREDLYQWIRASQKMIADGHPKATELWSEWSPTVMTNFTDLTDEEIEGIFAYVDEVVNKKDEVVAGGGGATGEASAKGSNKSMYLWLVLGLIVLALILSQIIGTLRNLIAVREGKTDLEPVSFWSALKNKKLIGLIVFGLVLLLGYSTVNTAVNIGRQKNYAPEQPIKFSHATHAGLQQIDCQYCHDGARRSKHSVIPAANTCMNCHKAVKKGSTYGTGEITKIFASIGFNPNTDKYIENYESMERSEIETIYKKWIKDTYLDDKGLTDLDAKGEILVDEQWDHLVSSLTSNLKKKIAGPIEWRRVHNLPDHVYFNHAQHVVAGEVECEQCHGQVDKMEVLSQHAPLSMGWCINCHRTSEVKGMKNNPYYANTYKTYHKALTDGTKSKVTVEEIGGLECQKCHY